MAGDTFLHAPRIRKGSAPGGREAEGQAGVRVLSLGTGPSWDVSVANGGQILMLEGDTGVQAAPHVPHTHSSRRSPSDVGSHPR